MKQSKRFTVSADSSDLPYYMFIQSPASDMQMARATTANYEPANGRRRSSCENYASGADDMGRNVLARRVLILHIAAVRNSGAMDRGPGGRSA